MKLTGWLIALAAAALTPAAVAATPGAAAPQTTTAAPEAQPTTVGAATPTAAPATPPAPSIQYAAPSPGYGMPEGNKGIQPQVTEIGRTAAAFHNGPLLWMCALISIFVLALLGYTMVRFRKGANPTPSRTSHHVGLEVAWTLLPVLILVAIAIPSIRLISAQYSPPPADVTVKVIGHQWYWSFEFPDHGGFSIDSYMLKEANDPGRQANQRARTDADGPPLLAVDERLVIPAGKVVKFLVTSDDVIHSFAVPAFWTKMDANPGRINETWVKVDRPGVYFGQCSELCGARHGFMPLAVEVVPEATFNAWVASKGGTPKGARPSTEAPAPVAVVTPAAAADGAAVEQPALNQAATAQN